MKPFAHTMALVALIGAMAGCAAKTNETDATATPGATDRPFQGQTLTILDHGAFDSSFDELKPIFEAQTGARVEHIKAADAGDALRQALLNAGNPVADVLYGVDNALFFTSGVQEQNLFLPYESPNLHRINASLIDVNQFRAQGLPNGRLLATPVDHGYISVNYDLRLKDRVPADELPRTLRDLSTQRWASDFVTEDPLQSSPGLGFLLASIATFPPDSSYDWKHYWNDLYQNGTRVVNDWNTAYAVDFTGGYGQCQSKRDASTGRMTQCYEIVTSYTTSPAAEAYFGRDFGVTAPPTASVEPALGVFHQVETMAILRGTGHRALAQAWIDFCLTEEFQSRATTKLAVYPVVDGIPLPDEFVKFATPPGQLQPLPFTSLEIGTHLEEWLDDWNAIRQAHAA